MTDNTTNKPSHVIYSVKERGDGQKGSYWKSIGAAWMHKDGNGFNLSLDYLPLDSNLRIVIREDNASKVEA